MPFFLNAILKRLCQALFMPTLLVYLTVQDLAAQNLIPNGDFEILTDCPTDVSQLSRVSPWFDPTFASADCFNVCNTTGTVSVPTNFIGEQQPQSGLGYAGIHVAQSGGTVYREYLEIAFSEPLIPNLPYSLKWHVSLADFSSCYPSSICAFILNGEMTDYTTTGFLAQLPLIEHTLCYWEESLLNNTDDWVEIESCFYATGDEKYLMIGNNYTDAYSACIGNEGVNNAAYVYVDNVTLTPMNVQTIVFDTAICKGQIVDLDLSKLINEPDNAIPEYIWQDGFIGAKRQITNNGLYTILIANGFVTDTIYINLDYLTDCPEVFIIPNAFSPNNDGINDKFRITAENINILQFDIYNRWGIKVFDLSTGQDGWDGTINGISADMGVYLYYLKYFTYERETYHEKTGYVTLIR